MDKSCFLLGEEKRKDKTSIYVRKVVQENSSEKAVSSSRKLDKSVTHWVSDDCRTSQ